MTAADTREPAPPTAPDPTLVRDFVDTEIRPRVERYDEDERVPDDLLRRVTELGLWAPFLPEEHGGTGTSTATLARIHEEIGRGCSSLRSLLTVHGMVSWSVWRWGDQGQRDRLLPGLAAGRPLAAFCLTEPEGGSDTSVAATRAEPDGDGWILTGHKKWITGGQLAGLLLVFAGTGEAMTAFLVPADAPGVTVTPLSGVLGTRASMLAEIRFDDVRLGPDAVLGPPGWAAATVMTSALDLGRLSVASGSVGIISAALEACADLTATRPSGDGVLADRQLVRRMLSDMITNRRAARLLCAEAGRLRDTDDPGVITATWVAKYFAATAAARAASDAVQVHGALGCGPRSPVARLYRDAKVMEIIEGSTELQQTAIADHAHREVAP
ncbi:acyl-CoA dehydrogenase family protein [Actinoalloteichus caeruleus]|uniref:acyl-CoA dehydrogenase family protein n=1 Tax=Actinoalloteichus cyanogriseus TaxID=2893586 RepID=UPI0004AA7487|nr:acyl-CoA dehydrogenase family protein [Actinoalloteichus caeruleus]